MTVGLQHDTDLIDDDAIHSLWAAVLRQAVRDACTDTEDGADARSFLRDPARVGSVCGAIGISTPWFQEQLRAVYPGLLDPCVAPTAPQPSNLLFDLSWSIPWLQL